MASSAFELLAAYVSISVRGAEVVTSAIDRVDAGMKRLTSGRALVTIQSNALQVANDITSVETKFVRTNDAIRRVNDQLAITHQRVLQIGQATQSVAARGGGNSLVPVGGVRGFSPKVSVGYGSFPLTPQASAQAVEGIGAATSAMSGLVTQMVAAAAAGAAIGVAINTFKNGVTEAFSQERAGIVFKALVGDANQARDVLDEIATLSQRSTFSFPQLREAGQHMLAVGVEAKDLVETLDTLTQIAAVSGGNVDSIVKAYTDVIAKGRVSAQELNQFANANVPVLESLVDVLGKNKEAVRQMVEDGAVGADLLVLAFRNMVTEGGKFAGVMDEAFKTSPELIAQISEDTVQIAANLTKWTVGLFRDELTTIRDVMTAIEKLTRSTSEATGEGEPGFLRKWVFRDFTGLSQMQDILRAAKETTDVTNDASHQADVAAARAKINGAEALQIEKAKQIAADATAQRLRKVIDEQDQAWDDSLQRVTDAADRRFTAMWRSMQRTRKQEEAEAFNDMLSEIRADNSAAEALRRSLLTPMDEFKQRITEAQQLLNKGLISDGEFNAAFKEASKDLTDIQKQVRAISNVRTAFIVGQSGELTFRVQSSRTQDLHLIEAKQQSRLDSERNKILSDIRTDLQKRADNAKPEVTADTFPTELF